MTNLVSEMFTLEEIGFNSLNLIILLVMVIFSFFFTQWVFSKYIEYANKKGWIGIDIHKKSQLKVAESGGIAFLIGVIPSILLVIFLFPEFRNESIVFLTTILISGVIGFIDDRRVLSSNKKILLTLLTGTPIYILNLDAINFLNIDDPVLPILGQLQLSIIYPLVIPIIITILTNTVNMLEGYNGEGSGTSLIVIIFLLVSAIISGSSEGLIFSLSIIGSLAAFVKFNKFPAKVFPGDVGTLTLGAAIACIAIFGALEVAMFCAILVHIFNSFYVISSLRGFKESHTITEKDIFLKENDTIHPSTSHTAPLTLPRLIVAEHPMKEPILVKHIWALAIIGGSFSLIAQAIIQTISGNLEMFWFIFLPIFCNMTFFYIVIKFKSIRWIIFFMVGFLLLGLIFLIITDILIVQSEWNWLITGVFAVGGLVLWYFLSNKYFWTIINRTKKPENGNQKKIELS